MNSPPISVIGLCLALFLATGSWGILSAEEYKVQIACQAWDEENQGFLGRVLVLEQLAASPSGSPESKPGTINAWALVATAGQPPVTENAPFRLRIYRNVSLISNLPLLAGHTTGSGASADDVQGELAETSFSMGTRDGDLIASLRKRTAGVNARGREMDYTGYARRVGSRLTFRSTWSNNSENSLTLFLKSSRAIVDTELGTSDSSEDGPYHCKTPGLVLEASEDLASSGNLKPGESLESTENVEPTESLVLAPAESTAATESPVLTPGENTVATESLVLAPGENAAATRSLVLEPGENFTGCITASPTQVTLAVLARDRSMVVRIQGRLAQQGINPGPIDGILGPLTTAALQAWNATRGEEPSDTLRRDELCLLLHRLPQP